MYTFFAPDFPKNTEKAPVEPKFQQTLFKMDGFCQRAAAIPWLFSGMSLHFAEDFSIMLDGKEKPAMDHSRPLWRIHFSPLRLQRRRGFLQRARNLVSILAAIYIE